MKAIQFDQLNPLDAANQEMTGMKRVKGSWARKYDSYFEKLAQEQANEAFWDDIFGRLGNFNSGTGGGFDFQAMVNWFLNGIADPAESYIKSWTYEQWVKKTEEELGRKLTQVERDQLAKGCIGLVLFALNITGNPPLTGGYLDFEEAKNMAIDLQEKINNNPGRYQDGARVVLYGFLFHTDDPSAYRPDKEGRMNLTDADLEDIDSEAKANNRTNFNFGVYDPKTKMMYDADEMQPGMRVFEKTINQFINSFGNRQAFYYRITIVPVNIIATVPIK